MAYLQKRASTWYVRIAIPKDLLTRFEPQREIKRSLHTSRLTEARKLASFALSDIQRTFLTMRYATTMQQKPPSKRAIEIWLNQNPGKSWTSHGRIQSFITDIPTVDWIQYHLDMGYEPDENGNFDTTKPPQNDPATYQQQHIPERVGEVKPTSLPTLKSKNISAVVDEYLFQDVHVRPVTRERKRTIFNHLEEYAKEQQCHEVLTEDSIRRYINEFLVNLKLEYGTRKNHFSILKTFSDYCRKKNYIDKDTLEAIRGIKIVVTQQDKLNQGQTANESYTSQELQALLNSFMDKPATSATTRNHRFKHIQTIYYVLVAMFTGFRVQTLGQLRKDSFYFTSEVHTITVRNELIETEHGAHNTNKTANSIRLPIVSKLEKLHFEKFVNIKLHKDKIFGATSTLDQRFDAQLESIDMKKDKQRLHAIRATVSNAYNVASDIPTQLKEQLLTHKVQSVAKYYDELNHSMKECPEVIRDKMERALAYKKIDFSRLNDYLKDQLSMFV